MSATNDVIVPGAPTYLSHRKPSHYFIFTFVIPTAAKRNRGIPPLHYVSVGMTFFYVDFLHTALTQFNVKCLK